MPSSNKKGVAVGKIVKPQGIKGEVKILPFADSPETIAALSAVEIGGKSYNILSFRDNAGAAYIKLEGVEDRNAAELLRGKEVHAATLPPLPEGRYYIAELLGAAVRDETGKILGTLTRILQHGTADVYCVESAEGDFMFPCIREVVTEMNVLEKTITVNAAALLQVAVYED